MKQLALDISAPPDPDLDNFVPGDNAELLERLRELAGGRLAESIVYIWGEPGSGRSHLLAACATAGVQTADDVENLDEPAQVDLFNRINAARESGGAMLCAGSVPPNLLPLREDLKSRLAWGLVYRVKSLSDEARAHYLAGEATRRGLRISPEIIDYLLSQARRDLPSLLAIMERLDRRSLELKRPLTLALARDTLREALGAAQAS
ncbi:MAG: DnaA regulatory inactivator Hda [Betaproteobacteria bacterium]|nr:DnaA regulatory inactivator Hda [Betaproteobacteria bacterium]